MGQKASIIQRINADEFLRGQRDCENGVVHRTGQHDDYDRGYSAQYALDQVIDSRTDMQCGVSYGK